MSAPTLMERHAWLEAFLGRAELADIHLADLTPEREQRLAAAVERIEREWPATTALMAATDDEVPAVVARILAEQA